MNMFAHLKSKPEMLSANDLLEIFPISRSGIYDLLREPGFPCIHLGRRIIVPRDAMSNEVSVMPETESEADTDLPETQIREDGVYIKVLPRDMKKPQAI